MNFLRRVFAKSRPHDLVGPPDPISNIRPIIAAGERPRARGGAHPYSLSEFSLRDGDNADLQWRIERDSLNAFNHAFWLDSNSRFTQAKELVLVQFQSVPMENQYMMEKKEQALSAFYARWSAQESARQAAYTAEWNMRNSAVIRLAIRRQLRIWRDTFREASKK